MRQRVARGTKMTKMSEVSFEAFLSTVKTRNAGLWQVAIDAGTPEETLQKVVKRNYDQYQDMSTTRVLSKTRADIEFFTTEKISGCIIGSSDKYDSGAPVRYILLKQDRKHIELSNFGRKTTYKDTSDYTIPIPSLVTIRAIFDPEFNNWKFACIETIQSDSLTRDNVIKVCEKVEIAPKTITKDMAFTRGKPTQPIVIRGKITGISPEIVFAKREEGEKAKIEQSFPVYVADESGEMKPCFNFRLSNTSGKFIRCHIRKQRYGKPTILVDDLVDQCRTTAGKVEKPEDQCKELNVWFNDIDVFVVGSISSYKESFDTSGKAITNVEVVVFAIIEIPDDRSDLDVGQTLLTPKQTEKPIPFKTEQKPLVADTTPPVAVAKEDTTPVKTQGGGTPTTARNEPLIAEVIKDLKIYCEAADISPTDLTLDVIKSRALDRFEHIPEGVLISAIMEVRSGK